MEINSFQKVEKQAEKYANETYIFDPATKEKINSLTKELLDAREPWFKIRDEWCNNGHSCRCKEHPEYHKYVVLSIQPIADELDRLYELEIRKKTEIRETKKRELLIAREAKIKLANTQF